MLRSVGEDDVRALFSRYGRVFELNLFRAFQVRVSLYAVCDGCGWHMCGALV